MRQRAPALLLLVALAACGATARDRTLTVALQGLNAARDGLVAYDADRQAQIVAAATSEADGHARLAAYRAARTEYVSKLEAAYLALAAAAVASDAKSLTAAIEAVGLARRAWEGLK